MRQAPERELPAARGADPSMRHEGNRVRIRIVDNRQARLESGAYRLGAPRARVSRSQAFAWVETDQMTLEFRSVPWDDVLAMKPGPSPSRFGSGGPGDSKGNEPTAVVGSSQVSTWLPPIGPDAVARTPPASARQPTAREIRPTGWEWAQKCPGSATLFLPLRPSCPSQTHGAQIPHRPLPLRCPSYARPGLGA